MNLLPLQLLEEPVPDLLQILVDMALAAVNMKENPVHARGDEPIQQLVVIIIQKDDAVRQDLTYQVPAFDRGHDFGEPGMQGGLASEQSDRLEISLLEGQFDFSFDRSQGFHVAALEGVAKPALDVAGPVRFDGRMRGIAQRIFEGTNP
jgi:hypothetical protein